MELIGSRLRARFDPKQNRMKLAAVPRDDGDIVTTFASGLRKEDRWLRRMIGITILSHLHRAADSLIDSRRSTPAVRVKRSKFVGVSSSSKYA